MSYETATSISNALQSRNTTATEVLNHFLKRLEIHGDPINAFSMVYAAEAQKAARELDTQSSSFQGLRGVPMPLKDLTEVEGWRVSYGSQKFKQFRPDFSRTFVEDLKRVGCVMYGQTTSCEFGAWPVTESEAHGITRNPWKHELTAGGSSGGAAAAVAAGLAPIAHASDGGGSIRIPASCCGLVGFKSSRGLVPPGPKLTESLLNVQGVVSRCVEDQALFYDSVSLDDPHAWFPMRPTVHFLRELRSPKSKKWKSKKVGFLLSSPMGDDVDPVCQEGVELLLDRLSNLGFDIVSQKPSFPNSHEFFKGFMNLWAAQASQGKKEDEAFSPSTNALIRQGQNLSAQEFMTSQFQLQMFSRQITGYFNEVDYLVTPTLAELPLKAGRLLELSRTDEEKVFERSFQFTPFTPWVNVTGQPAISLPLHMSEGIPIGVQIVSKPWRDLELLQFSRMIELECGYPDENGSRHGIAPLAPRYR